MEYLCFYLDFEGRKLSKMPEVSNSSKLYDFITLLKSKAIWKEVTLVQVGTEIAHRIQKSHLMIHSFPVISSADSLTDADTLHILPNHP
jgi:hypothetical protein